MAARRRKTSIEWAIEVDDRLRLLVQLAGTSAELDGAASANELLAALVCEQPLDPNHLGRLIARFRGIHLADVARTTDAKGGAPRPVRGRPRTAPR